MNYKYTYLFMGVLFFVVWLIFFLARKDLRKEILITSFIGSFAGFLADLLYTKDWWSPLTITDTKIGPETFFVGFVLGGIASVIYKVIFRKKLEFSKDINTTKRNLTFLKIFILSIFIFFGSYYLLGLNSLIATAFAFFIPTIIMWVKRKDLIISSVTTSVLLLLLSIIIYYILELLTPGWISAFWINKNIPMVLSLPLNDVIWYLFGGLLIGPIYAYWQEGKLINNI